MYLDIPAPAEPEPYACVNVPQPYPSEEPKCCIPLFCAPSENRSRDLIVMRHTLYQLDYDRNLLFPMMGCYE
jgi:hypothetical protein